MAQSTYDISFTQGDSFIVTFTLKDSGGTPVSLATATITSQIKTKQSATAAALASFTVDATNAATGIIILTLPAATTSTFAVTKDDGSNVLYYDVQVTWPSTAVQTVVGGTITVLAQVTT